MSRVAAGCSGSGRRAQILSSDCDFLEVSVRVVTLPDFSSTEELLSDFSIILRHGLFLTGEAFSSCSRISSSGPLRVTSVRCEVTDSDSSVSVGVSSTAVSSDEVMAGADWTTSSVVDEVFSDVCDDLLVMVVISVDLREMIRADEDLLDELSVSISTVIGSPDSTTDSTRVMLVF